MLPNLYEPVLLPGKSGWPLYFDCISAEGGSPDRWLGEGPPKASQSIPSVWGGQMTFSAGPRSCIGFKFALIEMKALLFTLIRGFQFELAVAPEEVIRRSAAVTRPVIKSEIDKGGQMPMIIRPFSHT